MVGKPFKKPFYTNLWFTCSLIIAISLNLLTIYNPFEWSYIYEQDTWVGAGEVEMPLVWKNKLMLLVLANSVATIIWEEMVVARAAKISNINRDRAQTLETSKLIKFKNDEDLISKTDNSSSML